MTAPTKDEALNEALSILCDAWKNAVNSYARGEVLKEITKVVDALVRVEVE